MWEKLFARNRLSAQQKEKLPVCISVPSNPVLLKLGAIPPQCSQSGSLRQEIRNAIQPITFFWCFLNFYQVSFSFESMRKKNHPKPYTQSRQRLKLSQLSLLVPSAVADLLALQWQRQAMLCYRTSTPSPSVSCESSSE